ncbi:MAG: hypothetical protein KKA52_05305 [Candidatus Omnitrophica bacterium]|nr:hypothetical protein [Candidatus Omnitrophota bacterium]
MANKNITPLKAVRAKCLDCSGFQPKEVKLCTIEVCPLYLYRLGKNPKRMGIGGNISAYSQKSSAQV